MSENQKLITRTCDRCKESTTTKLSVMDYIPGGHGGWLKIRKTQLCPKCTTLFWTKFMENIPFSEV
jgi:type II secretory ATPase GspE/PulE/Tfp pilus assembly ATPase PilB-like protein